MAQKIIRKHLRHQGHGTLSSEDVSEVTKVNTKNIDVNDRNMDVFKVERPKLVCEENIKILRHEAKSYKFSLTPGKYQVFINFEKPAMTNVKRLFSRYQKLYVTAWLIGGNNKFSNFRTDAILNQRTKEPVRLRFEVTEKDCLQDNAEMELKFASLSKLQSCSVTVSLYELGEDYCL
mmetsp:Transcript_27707/g.33870  ORF Transcript_27707/g.33870 Transcript_27707/m.33870 type:complete len:177 (-) Transcript_27707:844-1374(-)